MNLPYLVLLPPIAILTKYCPYLVLCSRLVFKPFLPSPTCSTCPHLVLNQSYLAPPHVIFLLWQWCGVPALPGSSTGGGGHMGLQCLSALAGLGRSEQSLITYPHLNILDHPNPGVGPAPGNEIKLCIKCTIFVRGSAKTCPWPSWVMGCIVGFFAVSCPPCGRAFGWIGHIMHLPSTVLSSNIITGFTCLHLFPNLLYAVLPYLT